MRLSLTRVIEATLCTWRSARDYVRTLREMDRQVGNLAVHHNQKEIPWNVRKGMYMMWQLTFVKDEWTLLDLDKYSELVPLL